VNLIKRANDNSSRKTPRSQTGSLGIETSKWKVDGVCQFRFRRPCGWYSCSLSMWYLLLYKLGRNMPLMTVLGTYVKKTKSWPPGFYKDNLSAKTLYFCPQIACVWYNHTLQAPRADDMSVIHISNRWRSQPPAWRRHLH